LGKSLPRVPEGGFRDTTIESPEASPPLACFLDGSSPTRG
jgi:hypothetical protein